MRIYERLLYKFFCPKDLKRHKKTCPKAGLFEDQSQVFPCFHCWRISTPHNGNMPHVLQKCEKLFKNTQNCHMYQLYVPKKIDKKKSALN